ncbi:MAG: TonB-dependent receptor plug domain-containing protein [Verrucomicrobia bacterium]|nr:TonB-dependent receptor plug domain-containing protein [Verrucomicrobiota bacterium]
MSPFHVSSTSDHGYGVSNTVGATRINVALKDVPQSITVLNREFLKDLGGDELMDAAKYVSGVTAAGAPNSGQMTLRGWNTSGATYRDGLFDPIYQHGGSAIDMSSYDRVEFIKGPSGTLYGSHTTGGIIDLVSKTPQSARRTTIRATAGDFSYLRSDLDTTGPVDPEKKLLYRLVVGYQDAENMQGLVNNRFQLTPSVSYSPTKDTSFLFRYAYQHPENSVNSFHWFADKDYRISTFLPKDKPLTELDDLRENEMHTFDFDATHGFNAGASRWDMRIKARYNDVWAFWRVYSWGEALYRFIDASGNVIGTTQNTSFSDPRWVDMLIGRAFQERKIRVKESNINYDVTGRFDLGPTAHKALTYLNLIEHEEYGSSILWDYPAIRLYNRVYNPSPKSVATNQRVGYKNSADSTAFAFGAQDNIGILRDRIIAVVGTRYDRSRNAALNALTNVPTNSVTSAWSQRFGLVGKPVENVSLFYNYAETFTAIPGLNTQDGKNTPWKNQIGSTNEGGVKLELFNSKLITTFSYFQQELNNARITTEVRPDRVTGGLIGVLEQSGKAKTKGFELDFVATPAENIALLGGYGDVTSTTERGPTQRAVPIGPNYRLWAKYTFTKGTIKGTYAGLGFEHTAKRDMAGDGLGTLPAYNSWDGLVGCRRGNWDAQVNVYNLTDANYATIAVAKFLMYGGDFRKIRVTLTRTF